MSNYDFRPITVELYLDFAAHLISLPETNEIPGAVEWLGERILSGTLPDYAAYRARPVRSFGDSTAVMHAVLCAFVHPDIETDGDKTFMSSMHAAVSHMRSAGLPPFPREHELDHEVEHKLL